MPQAFDSSLGISQWILDMEEPSALVCRVLLLVSISQYQGRFEMAKQSALKVGDTVAWSARFVRNVCGCSKASADERATVVSVDRLYAFVHWNHEAEYLASHPDAEYVTHVKAHGSMVLASNLARVGSVRFTDPHASTPKPEPEDCPHWDYESDCNEPECQGFGR